MIKSVVHDEARLVQRSQPATPADGQTITDLIDTLRANQENCVGMAANMIGVNRRIIVVDMGILPVAMINPEITKMAGPYDTQEGCLSLSGERPTHRFKTIDVTFLNQNFQKQRQTFTGFVAQIIQHEVEHCNGILI
ncbi:peptide deformylase [Levilactobacillus brevis]|jgi:peptide deformylase|uniref:N-formylmethionyl-tRNA deformylase n=1 Tax=Levilactobacillus brevis (strain ATCC 367 / BCRC 12310 / CIP 105137 / JCM 1170 / LMG 11437 / NCIMB 947 / NCTC 947) TaxID=387344 RepID=Q03P24_LEVBA|nr:peptide deformylase [Levilactobacillus brevis]MBL3537247.1 peptide deformylase [Lactobacillus sp. GPR40-2]MBL3630508.1 peptide deformylase [Lactobacillus sp. GPB7-4]ABJ65048.1 N-formylmethionyl-tRNA deformylase [Levilactobacillus brevis ATCC 367]KWU33316.1 peptide deformylase [Levilactobacillus brevis]MBU5273266.1 peptide deformylase [Levilactobacillus brevis]